MSKIVSIFFYGLFALLFCLCTTYTEARKKIPMQIPFPPVISDAVMCDVCEMTIVNAHNQIEEIALDRAIRRLTIYEDDVLGVLEHLCNPFREEGEWIRRVLFKVENYTNINSTTTTDSNNSKSGSDSDVNLSNIQSTESSVRYNLFSAVLDHFTQCKRTCATVRDLCEHIIDSEEADELPRLLLSYITHSDVVQNATRTRKFEHDNYKHNINDAINISHRVCNSMTVCKRRQQLRDQANKELQDNANCSELKQKGCNLLKMIEDDYPIKTNAKQIEAEEMMYMLETEEGRGTDMFSRQEMNALQDAIYRGDREAAVEIDERINELTDKEFDELRHALGGDEELRELET